MTSNGHGDQDGTCRQEISTDDRAVWAAAALAKYTEIAASADERLPDLPHPEMVQHLVAALCHAVETHGDSPASVLARGLRDYAQQYQDAHPGDLEFGFATAAGELIAAALRLADADRNTTAMNTLLYAHIAYNQAQEDD